MGVEGLQDSGLFDQLALLDLTGQFEQGHDQRHPIGRHVQKHATAVIKIPVPYFTHPRPVGFGRRPVVVRGLEIEFGDPAIFIEAEFVYQRAVQSPVIVAGELGVVLLVYPARGCDDVAVVDQQYVVVVAGGQLAAWQRPQGGSACPAERLAGMDPRRRATVARRVVRLEDALGPRPSGPVSIKRDRCPGARVAVPESGIGLPGPVLSPVLGNEATGAYQNMLHRDERVAVLDAEAHAVLTERRQDRLPVGLERCRLRARKLRAALDGIGHLGYPSTIDRSRYRTGRLDDQTRNAFAGCAAMK